MNKIYLLALVATVVALNVDTIVAQRIFTDPKLLQKFCGKNVDTTSLLSSVGSCGGSVSTEMQDMFSKCVTGSPTDMLSQICKRDSRAKIVGCFTKEMKNVDKKKIKELNKAGRELAKCLQSVGGNQTQGK